MIGRKSGGVRRLGRINTWAFWRGLERGINQLWERALPTDGVPERVKRYTAIDGRLAVDAEANVTEIENGSVQALRRPKRKGNRLEAKLELQKDLEAKSQNQLDETEKALQGFVARFPHAGEQLAKLRASRWKFGITIILALASELALTYVGVSYIAPDVGAETGLPYVVTWALDNMAIIATVGIVWATGLIAKSAGREAAWAFNPLVKGTAEHDSVLPDEDDPGPVAVYSDRSRLSHRVAFGLLAAALLALVVGLVLLREPALAALGGLSDGSELGGVAGAGAEKKETDGMLLFVGLFVVSAFPLFAAAWVSYLKESPLPSRFAALRKDVGEAEAGLKKAMKACAATEARIANVGVRKNAILAGRDASQRLARLVPLMGHEVMVEAQPDLFGLASTEPHPLFKPADKLGAPFPRGGDVARERYPIKPDPRAPETDVAKVPIERIPYVPPIEVEPQPNGNRSSGRGRRES